MLDDGLRVAAEGLDDRFTGSAEHALLDGAGERLAEVGLEVVGLMSLELPGFTTDLCHSLLALRMSSTGLSRYAAEARALVATAAPADPPWSGICAPGEKSNPLLATVAPPLATEEPLLRLFPNCRARHTF